MRRLLFVLCLACMIFIVSAPDAMSETPERETVKIRLAGAPDPLSSSPYSQADIAVHNAFVKKFPYIELGSFSGIQLEGQTMDSSVLMAIAGKMAPDVLYVNFRQSETYISQGFLAPLDGFIERMSQEELDNRVPKPVWPAIKRKGPDGKEHIWALPKGVLIRALTYRKDIFHEAGLDPNRGPKDWKELEYYASVLSNPEKGIYGIGLSINEALGAWDWITFLWSAGGKAVVQNDDGEWRAAFNGRAAAESMLYFVGLTSKKWYDAEGEQHRGYCFQGDETITGQMWDEGKIAMRVAYLKDKTFAGALDPDILGLAPVPLGPSGQRGSEINAPMNGIFAGIEDRDGNTAEEIREAAWEYIRFLDGEEAREIRTRVLVESGLGKTINPLYLKKYGYDEYLKQVPQEWLDVFEIAMENGQPEPYGKNCQMIYNFMTYPINEVRQLMEEDALGATEEEQLTKIEEILDAAVDRTNVEMIGYIAPDDRRFRNTVAFVVAVFVLAGFAFAVRRVWAIFTPEEGIQKGGWRFSRYKWAYIIMLPAVLSIFIWRYLPMLMGSLLVVQDYHVVGKSAFIGVQNFADVLWDSTWWASLVRTIYYMFLIFTLGFWTPIALALLLHEVSRFKIFYRTVYYLPAVLTGFVVIYLWKLFFDPEAGTLNQLLNMVGLPSLRWLRDDRLAMICCVIPTVWAGMGPGCLIYLAALKAVPDDLYEAADIDGAGFFGKIRHITLPTLKAIIIIQFIAAFIASAQGAGWILVMSGTRESTKVAGLHIWERAYIFLRFGSAITMAWIFGVCLLAFTVQQLKILSRMEFRAAGSADK